MGAEIVAYEGNLEKLVCKRCNDSQDSMVACTPHCELSRSEECQICEDPGVLDAQITEYEGSLWKLYKTRRNMMTESNANS